MSKTDRKYNDQKDKQWPTKHYTESKIWRNTNPVQCQNRKCTFNAKNRKLTYNDINMIVKFVQLLLYLRTKLKKTQKPFKTYLIIYNINLRTKDKRYLQILDMKVITINTLLKQLNKLPSLHFILFLSLYLYL